MKHRTFTQLWARRRTKVLLSLFKTQAPPDFHAQVFSRLQERQHHATMSSPSQASPSRGWQRLRQRLSEVIQRQSHGVTLMMVASRAYVLVLAVALLWWVQLQHYAQPAARHDTPPLELWPAETRHSLPHERLRGDVVSQDVLSSSKSSVAF